MATAMKRCRVCGKEYKACRTAALSDGVFRWQDVACSPECGSVYLQKVTEARGLADMAKKKERAKKYERSFAAEPVQAQVADDVAVGDVKEENADE